MNGLCRTIGLFADKIRMVFNGPLYTARLNDWSATFLTTTPREYHNAYRYAGEKNVLSAFLSSIQPDDIVYDIGANVGVFASFALSAVDEGFVVGAEPHSPTATRLRMNLAANAPETTWRVLERALANTDGVERFEVTNDMSGFPSNKLSSEGKQDIQVSCVSTLIDSGIVPVPDVAKIDVEGAELKVLNGFGEYLADVREIFVEIHPTAGAESDAIERRLQAAGFEISNIGTAENENTPMWHATSI